MSIVNLTIKRGDSAQLIVTTSLSGMPYSLTGHTIWFTAKFSEDDLDANAAIRKDSLVSGGQGGIVVNSLNSTATITINSSDTAALPNSSLLHYDVQIKSPTNIVTTVVEGIIRLTNDVTRAS